jgi:hypothetical protein
LNRRALNLGTSLSGIAMLSKLFASRLATESIAVYEIWPGVI